MIRDWKDPRDGRRWRMALELPGDARSHATVLFRMGRLELNARLSRRVESLKQLSDEEIIALLDDSKPH